MIEYDPNPGLEIIEPEDVDASLAYARETMPAEFRHEQQAWSEEHVGLYAVHMRQTFQIAIESGGLHPAEAAQSGQLLVASIVGRLTTAGKVEDEQLRHNVLSHVEKAEVADWAAYDEDKIRADFKADTALSLGQIRTQGAREVCARGLRMLLTTKTLNNG